MSNSPKTPAQRVHKEFQKSHWRYIYTLLSHPHSWYSNKAIQKPYPLNIHIGQPKHLYSQDQIAQHLSLKNLSQLLISCRYLSKLSPELFRRQWPGFEGLIGTAVVEIRPALEMYWFWCEWYGQGYGCERRSECVMVMWVRSGWEAGQRLD